MDNNFKNNQSRTAGVQSMELLRKEPLYQNADRKEQSRLRKQMRQTGEVSWDYNTWRNASVPKEWRDMEDRYAESSTIESISDNRTLLDNNYQQILNQKVEHIVTEGILLGYIVIK